MPRALQPSRDWRRAGLNPSQSTFVPEEPEIAIPELELPEDQSVVPGSRFINYGTLLGMNRGSARQMAQRLLSSGQQMGREAKSGLKTSARQFGQQLEEGQAGLKPVGGATYQASSPTSATASGRTGTLRQGLASEDPTAVTPAQAQAYANQHYTGPMGLANEEELLGRAQKASDFATAAGSGAPGLAALLARGGGSAGPGSLGAGQLLSGALAGTAGGGAFEELAKRYGGLLKEASQKVEGAKQDAQDAQGRGEMNASLWQQFLEQYPAEEKPSRPAGYQVPTEDFRTWLGQTGTEFTAAATEEKAREMGVTPKLYENLDAGDRQALREAIKQDMANDVKDYWEGASPYSNTKRLLTGWKKKYGRPSWIT